MNKVDVTVTRECPLILASTASPSCFGTMEIEKGGYVEIRASMNITIDVLKRAEEGAVTDRAQSQEELRRDPTYDFYIVGRSGRKGINGEDGADGRSAGCHGNPGNPGEPGEPGEDGPLLTIQIADLQNDFSLLNMGGIGGDGGNGGDGGDGIDYESGAGGNGGTGGDAGNGGNGGAGGEVTISYSSLNGSKIRHVNKKADGGKAGSPGKGGTGGGGKTAGSSGNPGGKGVGGIKGELGKVSISPISAPSLMRQIGAAWDGRSLSFCAGNDAHVEALFSHMGGRDFLQQKYPAVYRGLLEGCRKLRCVEGEDTKRNRFEINAPGIYKKTVGVGEALDENSQADYLASDVTGKFPDGMEYVYMSGRLLDENEVVEYTFAEEREATEESLVTDTDHSMEVYMKDIAKMNDMTYYSDGECYVVDQKGAVIPFGEKAVQGIVVEGDSSIVKKLKVTNPVHTNKSSSDKIIVLYARDPKLEEANTWDYQYPDNKAKNDKVNTKLKYSGEIEMKDGHIIKGYGYGGYYVQLFYQGQGEPTVQYNHEESEVAEWFHVSGDGKKCSFDFEDEDWNCQLDIKDYDVFCVQKLRSSFWIEVENLHTKNSRLVNIVINSSTDTSKPFFESEGTMVYIPEISIRWGCFHKDTRIRMADGSQKPIHAVRIGDCVATAEGGKGTVQQIYSGTEEELVCIETEEGMEIQVSKSHPLYTREGGRRACDIKPGDMLLMENDTVSQVRFAYLCSYGNLVYNLELEGGEGRIMANGFVAGDFLGQNTMPPQRKRHTRTPEAQETIDQLRALLREREAIK